MTENDSLLTFPCNFPIKIIGKKTMNFAREITEIIRRHFPNTPDEKIIHQESQKGNYLSITATVYVHNQDTLDALYRELTAHPDIKMVL
ncbi:HP0495 family protein [Legionella fairfieldensis]|uniref:HP0495 family protein n=1 Tax=Legionella fairfieldensis TaxID=45064 RepID=UPI00048E0FB8|nr:DUF493 domain-containing protein [Legionella fairfieldensis]